MEIWKISKHKGSITLVTPYCIVFGVFHTLYSRYECGVCLFVLGHSRASIQIN